MSYFCLNLRQTAEDSDMFTIIWLRPRLISLTFSNDVSIDVIVLFFFFFILVTSFVIATYFPRLLFLWLLCHISSWLKIFSDWKHCSVGLFSDIVSPMDRSCLNCAVLETGLPLRKDIWYRNVAFIVNVFLSELHTYFLSNQTMGAQLHMQYTT